MYSIIADSCCDMTPELRKELGVVSVPLTLTLDGKTYEDDDKLDLPAFMKEMAACKGHIGSAAPSPHLYQEAFAKYSPTFGITLSKNLSSTYQSAMIGQKMAKDAGAHTYIFDSKSASAGEILIAVELRKLIDQALEKSEIITRMENFIAHMKTFFVLDSVENLQKNGRLNTIVGKIISMLGIKPIMGADGDGKIALFSHARGLKKALLAMVDLIGSSGVDTRHRDMVITHCNNKSMAEELKKWIERKYSFQKIWIVPTRGVSSVYANEKGIVMAF